MNRAGESKKEQLRTLCGRVEHWRKHREGARARVPEELWDAAVEVARVEGVHATCKALRFNYQSLKDRLADRAAPSSKRAARLATFVEVQMPAPASPGSRDSAGSGQTVVELVGTGGARMRIDVTGTSNVDVVGLAQAFWSRES